MKKFIFFTFIILFSKILFSTSVVKADSAENIRLCNKAVDRLNTLGFSYPRYPQNQKTYLVPHLICGMVKGTDEAINILTSPLRLEVYNLITGKGYCVNWNTGRITKFQNRSEC